MDRLVQELIQPFLEDDSSPKNIALIPGGFKPPTLGHFYITKEIAGRSELDEVIVLIGHGVRDGIGKEKSLKIWEIYKKHLPPKVNIKISEKSSPVGDVNSIIKNNPNNFYYPVVGVRGEQDLDDIKRFDSLTGKYNNFQPIVLNSDFKVSGTGARKSLLGGDYEMFKTFLPKELSEIEKMQIWYILNTDIINEITSPKLKQLSLKFKNAFSSQKDDFKGFKPLVIKYLKKQPITDEEKEKLKRNFGDILKSSGVAITFPLLGISGTTLLGWLTNKISKGQFSTLPSKFKDELLEVQLNENLTYSNHIDYKKQIKGLTKYMLDMGMNIKPLPKVIFKHGDKENAKNFLGNTAYYNPENKEIVLYTEGRHPKDLVRSFSHEMIHHIQNLEGRLGNITTTNTKEDDHLNKLEEEANLKGTMTFRNWTDSLNQCGCGSEDLKRKENPLKKEQPKNDPFGLNQFVRELFEEEIIQDNVTPKELNSVEKIADEWFEDYGIDVKFTKHFIERVNDPRNGKQITPEELEDMFIQTAEKYGNKLSSLPDGYQAVLVKLKNDLNLPFVLNYDESDGEVDLVAKTIMRKRKFQTSNPQLTLEGRYDKISNTISSNIFKKWKSDFDEGERIQSLFKKVYSTGDIDVEVDAYLTFTPNLPEKLDVDGGADNEEDWMQVRFEVDPNLLPGYWKEISMGLKDVIRHEIEHLTHGEGTNLKPNKIIEDDILIRRIINAKLLPKSQYFKLEKEIDANLQGMYFRAKKEKVPFKNVIDNYLGSQSLTNKEKVEILDIWRTRLKALNLPTF